MDTIEALRLFVTVFSADARCYFLGRLGNKQG